MSYGLSANQKVVELFELALGMSAHTNSIVEDFLSSDVWERYGTPDDCPNPSTWDEVILAILTICTQQIQYSINHPATFRGEE